MQDESKVFSRLQCHLELGVFSPAHMVVAVLCPRHSAEPYKASLTSEAPKDGKTATVGVSCKASLLPFHLSPSFLTYYLVTKELPGETCYYSFLGVMQSQRQFSREMGPVNQCPEMGREGSWAFYSRPIGFKDPFLPP